MKDEKKEKEPKEEKKGEKRKAEGAKKEEPKVSEVHVKSKLKVATLNIGYNICIYRRILKPCRPYLKSMK